MKIVILDGQTTNPGDISWAPIEALGETTVYQNTPPELVLERAKDAEALIINRVNLTREVLEQLPKLRLIGMLATGYNSVDALAAREYGIDLCNVPDYCADTVAQQALTLLLALCGSVHLHTELIQKGDWEQAVALNHTTHPLYELSGKTLGIVGFGAIGRRVAAIGQDLGMKILLYSRTEKAAPQGCSWVNLETLFRESDVVSLHCPLNEQTHHLVDERLLSLMKPTALLINTARGGVVDSAALARVLNENRLLGAGIDVMEQEPPRADDPLLTAKNCMITPHIAWASREARIRLVEAVAENLRAFQNGTPIHVVNS